MLCHLVHLLVNFYFVDILAALFFLTFLDDDMDSVSSSVIGDSDLEELDQHLLPSSTADVHSIDVPPKLAKDLLWIIQAFGNHKPHSKDNFNCCNWCPLCASPGLRSVDECCWLYWFFATEFFTYAHSSRQKMACFLIIFLLWHVSCDFIVSILCSRECRH